MLYNIYSFDDCKPTCSQRLRVKRFKPKKLWLWLLLATAIAVVLFILSL